MYGEVLRSIALTISSIWSRVSDVWSRVMRPARSDCGRVRDAEDDVRAAADCARPSSSWRARGGFVRYRRSTIWSTS